MQASRDVGRRHHDREVFAFFLNGFVAFYFKVASALPNFIITLFNLFGVIDGAFFTHRVRYLAFFWLDYTKRAVRLGLSKERSGIFAGGFGDVKGLIGTLKHRIERIFVFVRGIADTEVDLELLGFVVARDRNRFVVELL